LEVASKTRAGKQCFRLAVCTCGSDRIDSGPVSPAVFWWEACSWQKPPGIRHGILRISGVLSARSLRHCTQTYQLRYGDGGIERKEPPLVSSGWVPRDNSPLRFFWKSSSHNWILILLWSKVPGQDWGSYPRPTATLNTTTL
jgi:hypothetical protein